MDENEKVLKYYLSLKLKFIPKKKLENMKTKSLWTSSNKKG